MHQPEAIRIENLHKSFGDLEVLKGISMTAHKGDVVAIIGGSGSGKSTLLRCINFLETPNSGNIVYAQTHFADVVAELKVYQSNDDAYQDLIAGRVDAIQADSIAMADFVASDSGACCEIKGAGANDEAILGKGIGAGLRKGDDALREKINTAIATIRADGTYAEITKKYFSSDIFGE